MSDLPVIIASLVALVGALGGVAAFMRAGADRSKVIVDSAETVVEMLRDQVNSLDSRLSTVEGAVVQWETWAERVLTLLDRAITLIDETHRKDVAVEAARLKSERPGRTRQQVAARLKAEKLPD